MNYTINTYPRTTTYNVRAREEGYPIQYIVIHYTAGTGSAYNNCKYFDTANRDASAHYFVDDSSIWEFANPDNYICWHVGDGKGKYGIYNSNSVGIEIVNNGGMFTTDEIARLCYLVPLLMSKYGIDKDHIVRHYDASHKCCPAYYAKNEDAWQKLRDAICMGEDTTETSAVIDTKSGELCSEDGIFGTYTINALLSVLKVNGYKVTVDGVFGTYGIKALQQYLAAKGYGGFNIDGKFGSYTIKALQRYLKDLGYTNHNIDGIFGAYTITDLQKALNDGKF